MDCIIRWDILCLNLLLVLLLEFLLLLLLFERMAQTSNDTCVKSIAGQDRALSV